ncbi:MAG: outer membrane lipoprotein-sorting protein [Spirochaetales bacterium]
MNRSQKVCLRILGILIVALLLPGYLFPLDGREVMVNVDKRPTGNTSRALVKMDLVDSKGKVNSRSVEMFTVKDEKDLKKMVVVFHAPASVKDTRYLAIENEGRDDDKWIYLPALKRVRRIAASEGGSSFMGSDFTYDDMSERDVDKDDHKLLREEPLGQYSCYVIESAAKDPKDSQYSKRISWIAKDLWVPIKIELYDKRGSLQKVATLDKIEMLQGFVTPLQTTMKNVQKNTSTILTMEQFVWNEAIPAGIFTTRFLETGKP